MISLFCKLGLNNAVWIDQEYSWIRYTVNPVPWFLVQIANTEGIHMGDCFIVKKRELNVLVFLYGLQCFD